MLDYAISGYRPGRGSRPERDGIYAGEPPRWWAETAGLVEVFPDGSWALAVRAMEQLGRQDNATLAGFGETASVPLG